MRTVSIFMNGRNQAVRLPQDMAFDGIGKLEISKEGDVITLRPARPSWTSLAELPRADAHFLRERTAVASDEGRFTKKALSPAEGAGQHVGYRGGAALLTSIPARHNGASKVWLQPSRMSTESSRQ